MTRHDMHKILLAAILVGCGYLLGASGPVVQASYSQEQQIVRELVGIRSALQTIARMVK